MALDAVAQGGVSGHGKDAAGAERGEQDVEHGWAALVVAPDVLGQTGVKVRWASGQDGIKAA